jgi:hypothetical protein
LNLGKHFLLFTFLFTVLGQLEWWCIQLELVEERESFFKVEMHRMLLKPDIRPAEYPGLKSRIMDVR